MTTAIHLQSFTGPAGDAQGVVRAVTLPYSGQPALMARLAFLSVRNPLMTESPCYDATFPVGADKRAVRALRAAARRRGLKAA